MGTVVHAKLKIVYICTIHTLKALKYVRKLTNDLSGCGARLRLGVGGIVATAAAVLPVMAM